MASDGASPLSGPDMTMKPGAAMSPFPALPFPPPTPGPPDQPPWEPPPWPSMPSAFSPGTPLVLSAFPSRLLMTGDGGPGSSGPGAGKVIVKVKTEGGPAESPQTQNFILTHTALNWIASGAPRGGPDGPPPQFMTASNVKNILPAKAVGVSQEGPPGLLPQALPPAAQLAPIVPVEKAWPGPHGAPGEGGSAAAPSKPSLGDLSYTSKGVYENFRRWQRYKALARRHLSQSPDAEALSCFLIPVLRSLARLKPTMTLEEGLPRAVQEWERTSNFDRMIFYEMAEKFMEFETEEEMQIQNAQLLNETQCLPPADPLKLDPPAPPAPEVCQQPVYIPKKAVSKTRAPRRRQRKSQKPPVPEAPKEIPPEAVKEYTDIMEGLLGSHSATGESDGKWEEEEEQQQEEEGMYPDPDLLSYIDELCSQEVFVSKVEAIIHPQFLADLLSPEQHRDPLALIEELEQEEGLTLAQLVQKRLMALEQEDAEAPASCSGAQSDSSPSISDEDEDGGGRLRPSSGPQMSGGTVRPEKATSPGKRAREGHGGQERAVHGLRGVTRDGNTPPSSSSWDLQLELAVPQGTWGLSGTERRGSGKVTNWISPQQEGHLGGAVSPGHSVADRTSGALPLCWQEDSHREGVPHLKLTCTASSSAESMGMFTEHQGAVRHWLWGNTSLCLGETILPGGVGSSVLPCGGTDATAASGKSNYCSLPGPLRASSPASRLKENSERNPETTPDPSDLWAEARALLLESRIDAPILGSSKETLLPACPGNILILGTQDASFPEASKDAESRGNSISPLLETREHVHILDVGDDRGLQLGEVIEGKCPPNVNSYDPQGEGREDTDLSKPKDLAPLPETPKSTSSHQGPGSTSPRCKTRDALVLRETSPVSKTRSSADGAKLSNFAYLLASKLSLSPRGLPLSPHPASGLPSIGQGVKRALHTLSAEVGGLGPPPYPAAKSGKQALVGGPASVRKRLHPGAGLEASGEKPSALVVSPAQPRKRRRDSFVTGRKKKRRRSQ
uniref:NUT midline carcinoma family member 1 n=1 Tax=Loxodonta africana TaxID=9785 RepID=G3T865_LOXAF